MAGRAKRGYTCLPSSKDEVLDPCMRRFLVGPEQGPVRSKRRSTTAPTNKHRCKKHTLHSKKMPVRKEDDENQYMLTLLCGGKQRENNSK